MLRQLKLHFQLNNVLSLYDVMLRFNVDEMLARQLLQHWLKKGCVCPAERKANCGTSCQQCHPAMTEMYQWVV